MNNSLLKLLFILTSFSLLYSCISFDKSELNNLNNNTVLKIGHGGSGFVSIFPFNPYPSNSMSSIKKALLEDKAEGVEVDVHMTSDGKFVLYHDRELDSKTNKTGCIELMPYSEVITAEYEAGFPYDFFHSERIIGLDELLKECKAFKSFPFLHFDLRVTSPCFTNEEDLEWEKRFFHGLVDYLKKERVPKEKVILISLRRTFLEYAADQNSPYPLSFEEHGTFEEGVEFVKQNGIKYLTLKPVKLSKEKSELAHENGIQIITFGANSKRGNKRLLELNPDIIQTNNLGALQELIQ